MSNTTDAQLKKLILRWFYERRDKGKHTPSPSDFGTEVNESTINRICIQLKERGLINGVVTETRDSGSFQDGYIIEDGVRAIEEGDGLRPGQTAAGPTINIKDSTAIQIGDHNSQEIDADRVAITMEAIAQQIEASDASEAEKEEAKSRFRGFLEHPLVEPLYAEAIDRLPKASALLSLLQ